MYRYLRVWLDPPCRNVTSLCYCCSDGPHLYTANFTDSLRGKSPGLGCGRELGMSIFVTFSAILRLNRNKPVVSGRGNRSARQNNTAYSQVTGNFHVNRTQAVMGDSYQSMATL